MLRVGVVGVGVMGSDHAERLARRTAGVELAAVSDADEARASEVAGRYGVPVLDPFALIEQVDAVLIASPGFAHAEQLEACLAYLVLPPAGGVVLLLFEHKSDYVRFHAWQSSLVFGALFLVHVIFSWTSIVSWMLFVFDVLLIAYLAAGAWRHAETLDRVEVPFFGRLASSFVDDE